MIVAASKFRKATAAGKSLSVDQMVLSTVNAPYKRDISSAALENCIAHAKLDVWPVHVATFFTDVSTDLVLDFASFHGIPKSKLAEAYMAMKAMTGEQSPDLEAELVALAPSP